MTVEDSWWARGGMCCKGDWHRKTFCFLGHVAFYPIGPLQMLEQFLDSLLQMDRQCRDLVLPSKPLFLPEERTHWQDPLALPHHSHCGERGTCAVLPLCFQAIAWNSGMGLTWFPSRQQMARDTNLHALPAPRPHLASLCHQVPTDHTSAICKALQKKSISKSFAA